MLEGSWPVYVVSSGGCITEKTLTSSAKESPSCLRATATSAGDTAIVLVGDGGANERARVAKQINNGLGCARYIIST